MGKYFTPDHAGIEDLAQSAGVAALVDAAAQAVAAAVRPQVSGAPVVVDAYEYRPRRFPRGRRAARSVTIARADGLGRQLRDGVLTRAAAAQGLEVRERAR